MPTDQICSPLPAGGGFFDTTGFLPRWQCGSWNPALGWLTIVSDLTIAAAYVAIPVTIIIYIRRRPDVVFPGLFWLFCAFILLCGTTHLIDALAFWWPAYPVAGLVKLATAIASVATVAALARALPQALALPGLAAVNRRLQAEVAARTASEEALRQRSDELQESRDRLVAAQTAAAIGDWAWDLETRRMRWSEEMFRLFERDPAAGPPADLAAHNALYAPAGARTRQRLVTLVEEGQASATGELAAQLPSGRECWFRCIVRGDRHGDGRLRRLWGTVQDITSEYNEAEARERQRQDLLRINEQLEQFAYIASHDLLEPVRKVRFFADVVREESAGRLGTAGDDALQRLLRSADRMNGLIHDLLALARAGKSLAEVGPVPLGAVVAEAAEAVEAELRACGGRLETTGLPTVLGGHGLLVQVFQNLISNSLRYRDPSRAPLIWIQGAIEGTEAVVSVSDNGLGFDPAQAQRLFEPFVRLHPQVGGPGNGIGLAICRRIVESHGGTIEAVPLPGAGACFTIRLPLAGEAPHA